MKLLNRTESRLRTMLWVSETFDVFNWELRTWKWVPLELRRQIAKFWSDFGRDPEEWIDSWYDYIPTFGEKVWIDKDESSAIWKYKPSVNAKQGKFILLWNNQAAVVLPDGSYVRGSIFNGWKERPSH